jgi:hypothetical protein
MDRSFLTRGLFAFAILALACAAGAVATIHFAVEPAQAECESCG